MLKRNKGTLILTSIITLLPILIGLVLWNKLPDRITTHWDISGNADGWSSKPYAIFFLPLFLLVMHWFCFLMTIIDPRNKDSNTKMIRLALWIVPIISLIANTVTYFIALGYPLSMEAFTPFLIGILFILLGNYMPKCKQNYTIGVKVPWTLDNEENWNVTHRFTGKLWVGCGFAMIILGFVLPFWAMFSFIIVASFIPVIYSYLYYRKQLANH